jgi:hypothetical protein
VTTSALEQANIALVFGLGPCLPATDTHPDAQAVRLRVASVGYKAHWEIERLVDGAWHNSPYDINPSLFLALKDAMKRPGAGSWFSAILTLEINGTLHTQVNYYDDPALDIPLLGEDIVDELTIWPRTTGHLPAWLRSAAHRTGVTLSPRLDETLASSI